MSAVPKINAGTPFLEGVPNSLVSREWFRFLAAIGSILGGGESVLTIEDLAQLQELFEPNAGALADTAAAVGTLELNLASRPDQTAQIATLQAQINDLMQLVGLQQQQIATLAGLLPKEILYGSSSGTVEQNTNFQFDVATNGMLFAGATFYLDNAGGDLLLKSKGKGVLDLKTSGGADVNLVNISSNTTGNGAILTAAGTDTGVTLHVRSQGSVATWGNVVVGAGANPIAQFTGGTGAAFLTFANDANDPTIGTSSGAVKISGTALQVTGTAVPAAGAGAEIGYLSGPGTAYIQGYDRAGAGAWKQMNVSGLGIGITANGGDVSVTLNGGNFIVTTLPARVAGDKYVVADATGKFHLSAVGPAS